jgi:hypothetical protein
MFNIWMKNTFWEGEEINKLIKKDIRQLIEEQNGDKDNNYIPQKERALD